MLFSINASLNLVLRVQKNDTTKILVKINNTGVFILFYSCASHNFLSTSLILNMGISMEPSLGYDIILGDGHSHTSRVCKNIPSFVVFSIIDPIFVSTMAQEHTHSSLLEKLLNFQYSGLKTLLLNTSY